VGTRGAPMQVARLGKRGVGVVSQPGRDLERYPTVDPDRALVHRAEEIGRTGEVLERELEEELLVRQTLLRELPDVLVVGRPMLHRMIEYRGIRGQPGNGQLIDVPLQGAAREQLARDVVEPQALARAIELACR